MIFTWIRSILFGVLALGLFLVLTTWRYNAQDALWTALTSRDMSSSPCDCTRRSNSSVNILPYGEEQPSFEKLNDLIKKTRTSKRGAGIFGNPEKSSSWIESHGNALLGSCSGSTAKKVEGGYYIETENVTSFAMYGPQKKGEKYVTQLAYRIKEVKKIYPGYRLRVYTDYLRDPTLRQSLCKLDCDEEFDILDICDTSKFPKMNPMEWRFVILGDPTVHIGLVRDLDSPVIYRERDAVREWLHKYPGKSFHGMRDHPYHRFDIMGGMWGVNNYKGGLFSWEKFALRILLTAPHRASRDGNFTTNTRKGYDQTDLHEYLYPHIFKTDLMSHDSYHCKKHRDSVPFPTKREEPGRYFVGGFNNSVPKQCPKRCRPKKHRNWKYC